MTPHIKQVLEKHQTLNNVVVLNLIILIFFFVYSVPCIRTQSRTAEPHYFSKLVCNMREKNIYEVKIK